MVTAPGSEVLRDETPQASLRSRQPRRCQLCTPEGRPGASPPPPGDAKDQPIPTREAHQDATSLNGLVTHPDQPIQALPALDLQTDLRSADRRIWRDHGARLSPP